MLDGRKRRIDLREWRACLPHGDTSLQGLGRSPMPAEAAQPSSAFQPAVARRYLERTRLGSPRPTSNFATIRARAYVTRGLCLGE